MITQRQVAQEAGVSQRAVAFAVSDSPSAHAELRPATRQRILAVAARLGYRKNRYAQTMRGGRSGLIGVLHNTGLLQVAMLKTTAAAEAIFAAGYRPLSGDALWAPSLEGRNGLTTVCDTLLDARVEGVILIHMQLDASNRDRLLAAGMPIAQISGSTPITGVPNVRADVRQGMTALVRHLLSLGHRRLTLLSYQRPGETRNWSTRERQGAFLATLRAAGIRDGRVLAATIPHIGWEDPYAVGRDLMARLLSAGAPLPDAVICQNDDWAHGALAACTDAGVRVPEDLAIAGFDGSPLSGYGAVPLTTVAQPCRELASKSVGLLVRMIRGEKMKVSERLIKLPCEVVVRRSCGAPASCNPCSAFRVQTRRRP